MGIKSTDSKPPYYDYFANSGLDAVNEKVDTASVTVFSATAYLPSLSSSNSESGM